MKSKTTLVIDETFQQTIQGEGQCAAMSATIHVLRSEIRKYKKMEQEATNLWKKSGIYWDD